MDRRALEHRGGGHYAILLSAADDFDIDSDGILYLATHLEGAVRRVDPDSGRSCVLTHGLSRPTAVKVVSEGDGRALVVTSFDGTVRKLTPPAGVDI